MTRLKVARKLGKLAESFCKVHKLKQDNEHDDVLYTKQPFVGKKITWLHFALPSLKNSSRNLTFLFPLLFEA